MCFLVIFMYVRMSYRSESFDGGLQVPQSAVTSYFKEQSSGKWELQIPEDTDSRESHRWPIGFVTTGFVRGRLVYRPLAASQLQSFVLHFAVYSVFALCYVACNFFFTARSQWQKLFVRQFYLLILEGNNGI